MQQSGLKSPARIPSDALQRVWIALGRVSQAVQCEVETALKDAKFPELSWYTVLWELERAGTPTRPKDLAIPLFILSSTPARSPPSAVRQARRRSARRAASGPTPDHRHRLRGADRAGAFAAMPRSTA
jgi:hypothetical protein